MAFETKATVKYVLDTKQISEKFSKRSLVVEVPDGKYPQTLEFEATGDKIALLDPLGPGDTVTITWDLRGREKKGNDGAFNSLNIWKLNVDSKAQRSSATSGGGTSEDLPF
jgi:hypothetical protein